MRWKVGTGKSVGACRVCPEMVSPHPGGHNPTAVDWLRQALGNSELLWGAPQSISLRAESTVAEVYRVVR